MKRSGVKFIVLALAALFTATFAFAQPKIFSKKENLKDIGEKTLMVVIENNSFLNLSLKDAVTKCWDLSKVEFCSTDDFNKFKTDTSYYFLVEVDGQFKKEDDPGIEFLSLLKGGPDAIMGVEKMYDVLSLPLQPVDDGSGYILPFLETYIKIIKSHVKRVQESKVAATIGISWYSNRLSKIGKSNILINEADLSEFTTAEFVNAQLQENGKVVDEDTICEAVEKSLPKILVSISIAPDEPKKNSSYCYKMLVGAEDGELYYYRKQKVTAKAPKGFLPEDIKKIAIPFIF